MEFTAEIINRFLLEKSHLTEYTKTNNIVQIMEDLLGLHATNNTTPYISLFCRGRGFTTKELHEILYESKNIAKIRCIRGTVFFQYQSLIPIMHAATFEYRQKQMQKRLDHFNITQEVTSKYSERMRVLLKDNPLTTKEIRKELQTKDELSSILMHLADIGVIVRSKPRKNWMDRMHTYELLEETVPNVDINSITKEDAQNELIRKYVEKYGPVSEKDISWWTGFNKTFVKNILSTLAEKITIINIKSQNADFFVTKGDANILQDLNPLHESVISILPCLDPYIMGYKIRNRYVEEYGKEYIFDRSGNATNCITLNGKITGIWDWEPKDAKLKFFIFGDMTTNQRNLVRAELENLGRFLFSVPFDIIEKKEMERLSKRTAGWVLKPLRD